TTTRPTGQALNPLADTTTTGRLPPCSPGPTGSRSAYHTSPRLGIDWLNRALFPRPPLLAVVPPGVAIGIAQPCHLLGAHLKQRGVEGIARELVQQRPHGDPTSASCFSEAVPHMEGYLEGCQFRHTSKGTRRACYALAFLMRGVGSRSDRPLYRR